MKKIKKNLMSFILALVLVFTSTILFADNNGFIAEEITYGSFSGIVKEVSDYEPVEGSKIVLVESWSGEPSYIIISKDTFVTDMEKLAKGASITAFYDANAPMIMIYPPQYSALIVAISDKAYSNAVIDRFDNELISSDKNLKLNVSLDTVIVTQNGEKFEGELSGRKLLVVYDFIAKSLPAQTSPLKIVVLQETYTMLDVSGMELIVAGKKLEAPAAYTNKDGKVMIPLRAVAEALGYEVTWEGSTRSVTLDKEISLTIDKDSYTNKDNACIQLGAAPELTNSRTFVPLNFFRDVVKLNNAYVFEGQIVIDNEEKME